MHTLHHGDCLDVLRTLPDCSVHAVVTDPPAGIAFMGKAWDGDKGGRDLWVAWLAERLAECLRVLKPGGHAVVWALPRTSGWTHRALEDAGFEVRDCITHLFGSGFPKSLDVGKAIDKAAGAEREVCGSYVGPDGKARPNSVTAADFRSRAYQETHGYRPAGGEFPLEALNGTPRAITAPATVAAQQWDGWGTALKPAAEFWYLARKPLVGTVAGNVQTHGTGALNIAATRIPADWATDPTRRGWQGRKAPDDGMWGNGNIRADFSQPNDGGRWPANVALTHNADCDGECTPGCAVAELDRQSGATVSPSNPVRQGHRRPGSGWDKPCNDRHEGLGVGYGDTGGASRFFPTFRYQAKPSAREKSAGLDHLEAQERERRDEYRLVGNATAASGVNAALPRKNPHPTVKPVELMRWLVRLVTPPGGVVLDCFAGSGTTLVAATLEGFDSIGIEAEAEYLPVIEGRVRSAERQAVQDVLPGF